MSLQSAIAGGMYDAAVAVQRGLETPEQAEERKTTMLTTALALQALAVVAGIFGLSMVLAGSSALSVIGGIMLLAGAYDCSLVGNRLATKEEFWHGFKVVQMASDHFSDELGRNAAKILVSRLTEGCVPIGPFAFARWMLGTKV